MRHTRRKRSSNRSRVERVDLVPVALEALGPGVQGQGVVPAQILDVDDLQPAVLHGGDGLRQARDPAAREDVLADVELGVAHANVADEVQHAQPAGLEEIGVRLDHFAQLVAAGVLEHADGNDLVELGVHFAEIGLAHLELVGQAPCAGDLRSRSHSTCSVVVFTPHTRTPQCSQARNMKPPKPQPMSTTLSPGLSRILLHTWSILLRWASSTRARARLPVAAGVHHQRADPASSRRSPRPARSGSGR